MPFRQKRNLYREAIAVFASASRGGKKYLRLSASVERRPPEADKRAAKKNIVIYYMATKTRRLKETECFTLRLGAFVAIQFPAPADPG